MIWPAEVEDHSRPGTDGVDMVIMTVLTVVPFVIGDLCFTWRPTNDLLINFNITIPILNPIRTGNLDNKILYGGNADVLDHIWTEIFPLSPGRCGCNIKLMIFNLISRIDVLEHFFWNCPQVNATRSYWWLVNIGWGNDLMSSGSKSLPEQMSTQIYFAIWRHLRPQLMSQNVCLHCLGASPTVHMSKTTLQWRHNGRDSVSNNQPHGCLLNRLFRRRSKKTSKLRVTGLCAGNSPGIVEFPAQMASYAENVSIWWRHHVSD